MLHFPNEQRANPITAPIISHATKRFSPSQALLACFPPVLPVLFATCFFNEVLSPADENGAKHASAAAVGFFRHGNDLWVGILRQARRAAYFHILGKLFFVIRC